MRSAKRNRGMTLLELLTVVIIAGILAGLAIPQYFNVQRRAKSAAAMEGLGAIRGSQVRFRAHARELLNADRYAKASEAANLDVQVDSGSGWSYIVCQTDAGTDCASDTDAAAGTAITGPNAKATNTDGGVIYIDLNTGTLCSDTGIYLLKPMSGNCK